MKTISIPREGRTPSQIFIGSVIQRLDGLVGSRRAIMITDPNLVEACPDIVQRYEHIVIGLGERNKTLSTVARVHSQLVALGADRTTFIIGMGGGIVTDITGFVASTYMRGLDFGFVATSLLAQVDASVGGKNGVNLGGYKNMVGVFNQPDFVLCDVDVLRSLPRREFVAGLAEVVKSAVIGDAALFEMLEHTSVDALLCDNALLGEVVARTVVVKARIVAEDEHEHGSRRLLNLGHTVAHAIEKCSRRYVHGEAVAVGMCSICRVGEALGVTTADTARRIKSLLAELELPTTHHISATRIAAALHKDKKGEADSIFAVLPCEVGRCEVRRMKYDALTELL